LDFPFEAESACPPLRQIARKMQVHELAFVTALRENSLLPHVKWNRPPRRGGLSVSSAAKCARASQPLLGLMRNFSPVERLL